MANLTEFRRIFAEDFDENDRAVVEKLAHILNPFLEQFLTAFDGELNFDNLAQDVKTVTLSVDTNGVPTRKTAIPTTLTDIKGTICIKVENTTDSTATLSSTPFVTYSLDKDNLIIDHVAGLTSGNNYSLNLLILS